MACRIELFFAFLSDLPVRFRNRKRFKLRDLMARHPTLTLLWMGFCGITVAWMGHAFFDTVFEVLDFINKSKDWSWLTLKNVALLVLMAVTGTFGLLFYIQFKVCEKVIVEEFLK